MNDKERFQRYIANAIDSGETDLERLFFLGSVRDGYTGHYVHEGLTGVALAGEVHSTLYSYHQLIFNSILHLGVIQLARQLRYHLVKVGEPERETCLRWLELEPFRDLIPTGCTHALRALFISQVRTALEVLCRVPDWEELAVQDALPQPPPDQPLQLPWIN
jgi:hypothetical protein